MFSGEGIEVTSAGNYQQMGVEKEVRISEIVKVDNPDGIGRIQLKTVNDKNQSSVSKKLNLNTVVKEGNKTSAWNMSARYLKGVLASMGYDPEQQNDVLKASNVDGLVKNLTKAMVNNKPFEAIFSGREYYKPDGSIGKAIEMYITAPFGSNYLVWDEKNPKYFERLANVGATPTVMAGEAVKTDLPF